jgi:hypothetical protein
MPRYPAGALVSQRLRVIARAGRGIELRNWVLPIESSSSSETKGAAQIEQVVCWKKSFQATEHQSCRMILPTPARRARPIRRAEWV